MIVELRAVHGSLKSSDGSDAGHVVKVSKKRFLVGSGDDCHLCCRSDKISDHHCEILILDQRVAVLDLDSQTGTFVNEQRIKGLCELAEGDSLKFGRLEFEVHFKRELPKPKLKTEIEPDDGISDWMLEADQLDREDRLANPEARQLTVEPPEPDSEAAVDNSDGKKPAKKKKPEKKKPGKLPKRKIVAEDSIEAAEEGLKKLFRI